MLASSPCGITPEKLCLGILDTKFIIRPPEGLGKKEHQNSRNSEDKESFRWIEGYQIACEIAEKCPETLCVCIGDRESDIYELYTHKGKAEFLVRARHDRATEISTPKDNLKVIEENKRLKEEIKLPGENNEKLRNRKKSRYTPEIVAARKKILTKLI